MVNAAWRSQNFKESRVRAARKEQELNFFIYVQ